MFLVVPAHPGSPGQRAVTHTHNRFTALVDFVWECPGERVPER